ncbi:unnamed protein product, partial [Prorocentrum cordatum]
ARLEKYSPSAAKLARDEAEKDKAKKQQPARPPKSLRQQLHSAKQRKQTKAKGLRPQGREQLQQRQEAFQEAQEKRDRLLDESFDANLEHERASEVDTPLLEGLAHLGEYEEGEVKQEVATFRDQLAEAQTHQNTLLDKVEKLRTQRSQLEKRQTEHMPEASKKEPAEQPGAPPAPASKPAASGAENQSRGAGLEQAKAKLQASKGDRRILVVNIEKCGPRAHEYINEVIDSSPATSTTALCETHVAKHEKAKLRSDQDKEAREG